MLLAALSCGEPTVPPPEVHLVFVAATAVAGTPTELRVNAMRSDGSVVPNVVVAWSASAGTLQSTSSTTDANGTARVMWTPPTTPGTYTVSATVGQQAAHGEVTVDPGPVVRISLSSDSIRLTRSARPARVLVRAFDAFNNQVSNAYGVWPFVNWTLSGPSGLAQVGTWYDSVSVTTDWLAKGSGEIQFTATGSSGTAVLARLKVVVDVALTLAFRGPDSLDGVAPAETFTLTWVATDSIGRTFVASVAQLGLGFSSSDASVASVDTAGVITGVSPGGATITATRSQGTQTVPVRVIAPYDLGALQQLYEVPAPQLYSYSSPALFSPVGNSLLASHALPHAGGAGNSLLQWYGSSGTKLLDRILPYRDTAAVGPNGGWYSSRPLSRTDSAGTIIWSSQRSGGVLAADSGLVVLGDDYGAIAFSPSGDSLWTYPSAGVTAIQLSATRVLVSTTRVNVLNRAGAVLWSAAAGTRPPVADETGRVFVPGASLVAYSADGSQLWTVSGSGTIALGPDNSLLVRDSASVRSLDRATGQQRWSSAAPSAASGAPPRGISVIGNRVLLPVPHIHVYDAATGQWLGRTTSSPRYDSPLTCTSLGLAFTTLTSAVRHPRCQ